MDIIQIIDELEQEFVNSKNFLWSKKTLVDMEKCAGLIAELKTHLPTAIQEARYILSKKEQILSEAQQESEKMLSDTKKQVEHMISTSEIAKQSEKYADELVAKANKKCEQLFFVTKENIDKMLKSVETYLDQNLEVVKRNRDELENAIDSIKSSVFSHKDN
jgi:transposase